MEIINVRTRKDRWQSLQKDKLSLFLTVITYALALLSFLAIFAMVVYILVTGVPNLNLSLFAWTYDSQNVSMMPALINTIYMILLTLLLAVPLGVGGSIYLTEYAKNDGLVIKIIRIAAQTLSGIPSIIYGLFGSLFLVKFLHLGLSLLSGALTLAIMILPIIIQTTEEALLSVPDSYREGAYALGAGKLRTIFKIVLPSALPGIFAGITLAIGRIIGESAALIFTSGTVAEVASSLSSSTRTLAVHMYTISGEGLYVNQTYATAAVLLFLVLMINGISGMIANYLEKRGNHE